MSETGHGCDRTEGRFSSAEWNRVIYFFMLVVFLKYLNLAPQTLQQYGSYQRPLSLCLHKIQNVCHTVDFNLMVLVVVWPLSKRSESTAYIRGERCDVYVLGAHLRFDLNIESILNLENRFRIVRERSAMHRFFFFSHPSTDKLLLLTRFAMVLEDNYS